MGNGRDLEQFLSEVNSNVALREFTFSKNEFSPNPGNSKEFADGVLWLDHRLVVYQTKDRDRESDHRPPALEAWFREAIEKVATRQIRNTHKYLKENDAIVLTNARGHRFNVNTNELRHVVNVILYGSRVGFPSDFRPKKYHLSRTSGLFMHILSVDDYVRLCRVLITPMEVTDYFLFRERYLIEVPFARDQSEKSLVGRFLMSAEIHDHNFDKPGRDFSAAVDNLSMDENDFRAWKFLEAFGDRVVHHERLGVSSNHEVSEETRYYDVLMAFARLRRTLFKKFSERLFLAIERAEADQTFVRRFEDPEQRIGYVVLAIPRSRHSERKGYLLRLVKLNMYERKLGTGAGVSVCFGEHAIDIDWVWIKERWAYDAVLEEVLEAGSPFPPLKHRKVLVYPTNV